ncbi:MAG: TolC family protein [Terriglobales bacterium]
MSTRLAVLLCILAGTLQSAAQTTLNLQAPPSAAPSALSPSPSAARGTGGGAPQSAANGPLRLSVKDAEAIALKNNPAITVARLQSLASQQVTREVRSSLWPQAYANFTGVDARELSRITAGALNNPQIFERAAAGTTVRQLITDFGHTTNLVASASLHAKAEDQNAIATKEQVLLAVDQAFYGVLQAQAVLRVAEQTAASRQLLADQVAALAKSQLKSDLDLSFANVNLAQAKLLYLDALNSDKSAIAGLSAILGYPTAENLNLVEETEPLQPPPADVDQLIAEAFSKRPEILSLEFDSQSAERLHRADRDQLLPTVSALGAIGDAPFRDDRIESWYGAVGVNVQIPIFNGFLYTAKAHETELQAQAVNQRLADLRNRISRDVRTSWLNANTAFDRVSVNQQLLVQANRALDLAQTRYRLGLSSIVELSQAQLQQTQAEIGSAQAGYEYRLALSVVRYQVAGL